MGWVEGRTFFFAAAIAVAIAAVGAASIERTRAGRALVGALHAAEAGFLALLLAILLVLSFTQIILRNVAHTGFVWIDPLLRHVLLWIGFVGGAVATRREAHISVDALSRYLPPGPRRAARILSRLFAAAICIVLAYAVLGVMRDEAEMATTAFLGVPVWVLQGIMPATLLVMSVRFLGQAMRAEPPAPEPDAGAA